MSRHKHHHDHCDCGHGDNHDRGHDHDHDDFDGRDYDNADDHHNCDCEDDEMGNPLDNLQDQYAMLTESAFQELVHDKLKSLLNQKIGPKLDKLAEITVDHFIAQHELELKTMKDEDDFDENFKKAALDD